MRGFQASVTHASLLWSVRRIVVATLLMLGAGASHADARLTAEQSTRAASNYQQFCALCHGKDREGHANDHAPSLRSQSLMEAGQMERFMAVAYGRPGTPMAGFYRDIGGPLGKDEIRQLTFWLESQAGVTQIGLDEQPVAADAANGAALYAQTCSECHGARGEGVSAPALGNPAMLAMTRDSFIRHAITHGRQGTPMAAFAEQFSTEQINDLVAFIRSRATGWEVRKPVWQSPPAAQDYVLNPDGEPPQFELRDDRYVMSKDLYAALQDKRRMVLLDTRNMALWQLSHIEGAVPLPYYYDRNDFSTLASDLPRDGTWIVTYCECPRAAAEHVNASLAKLGFENLAVLWEGAFGWIGLGYPVSRGQTVVADVLDAAELVDERD
ncbi:MAG: c-type cytochrome [Pseudomonadota bacterium]